MGRVKLPANAVWTGPPRFATVVLAVIGCLASGAGVGTASGAALDWISSNGWRTANVTVPAPGRTGFTRLTSGVTGIQFTNFLSEEKALENSRLADGSGVAAGDVDGDGWCDLYFCRLEGPNVLYRNLGHWRFQDVTASAGVACPDQYSTGATFADVDGDGDLDLLVTSLGGGARLFENDGRGRFQEAADAGLGRRFGATSMALADLDGDGSLDLYVCNYATTKIEDRPNARFDSQVVGGRIVITAIDGVPTTSPDLTNRYFVDANRVVRERGEPDFLYLNDGHGRFRAVSWTGGTFVDETGRPLGLPPYDFSLSVRLRDIDGDQLPDIYVCVDLFPPDRIWINDGRGRFRPASNLAVRHTCRFGMGMDFADINRDGFDDFLEVDMFSREHARRKVQTVGVMPVFLPIGQIDNRPQYMRNMLHLNRGDGTYAEIAQLAGIEATEWSWQPAFVDVDLDGWEDLLVVCGYHRDSLHADAVNEILSRRRTRKLTDAEHRALKRTYFPILRLPTLAWRNQRDLTFKDQSREWGFDDVGISQGLCLADLDNDGDLDVAINRLRDLAGVYRNESAAPRVAVRLKGAPPNTRGIGARIRILGGPVTQSQVMECGGRYLSCDDTLRVFAAAPTAGGMTIEVTWRSGAVSVVHDVRPNRVYEIDETGARPAFLGPNPQPTPLFADVSALLGHTNVDEGFNDMESQPLLARRLSQLGPGVCWTDLDGDGWEELVVGSGARGHLAVYRNDRRGGFVRWAGSPFDQMIRRDQTTLLGWRKPDGFTALLAGSSNYEDGDARLGFIHQYDPARRVVEDSFPGWATAVGPLAMADVDGDGWLDLFAGGRVIPQQYPRPTSSLLFRGGGARFARDEENSRRLGQTGLVSGAVFSDLDGDGDPDLVLACEWGPLRVFRNDGGKLVPWDWKVAIAAPSPNSAQASTLDDLTGWWNSVMTGDFDGDGRLDVVAGNWGRNTKYEHRREQPLRIFYGEWRLAGTVDQMEAYYDTGLKKVVPWCTYDVAKAMPWFSERFPTHTAFSTASVAEVVGERKNATQVLEAAWLETTLFLNRGDHFEARILPIEAQFSPVFGISVADLDGNGTEDIFLAQNTFALDGDTSRYDAGRGLWLAGDGTGRFLAVPGQESGIRVYGEQRGCAVCDYDGDGRVDLVVTQNGAETKLYHNRGAQPGLRVRLAGPPGNPDGVGATIRAGFGQSWGPAREIHAGAGYWSQDSPVQVFGGTDRPERIQVKWPGGNVTITDVRADIRELTIDPAGHAVRARTSH